MFLVPSWSLFLLGTGRFIGFLGGLAGGGLVACEAAFSITNSRHLMHRNFVAPKEPKKKQTHSMGAVESYVLKFLFIIIFSNLVW